MLTFALPLASLVSLAFASKLDYSREFTKVTTASVTPTSGNYLVRNVATGEYLYFARDGQVGAYLGDNKSGINLESATFEGVTGVIIKGTDSSTLKCLAAQWNFSDVRMMAKRARDEYAVPYGCQLGSSGTGTYGSDPNDNDSNKQFWLLNAVSGDHANPFSVAPTSVPSARTFELNKAEQKDVQTKTRTSVTFSSAAATPQAKAYFQAFEGDDSTTEASPPSSNLDRNNQYTWDCQHDGAWLMRHEYDYIVILKHVECIAPLAAYKKSLKAKRATQEYFTIHPINHLNDMQTLALGGSASTGFNNMPAVQLDFADPSDKSQWWTIEPMV